jgi:hypothetical protein
MISIEKKVTSAILKMIRARRTASSAPQGDLPVHSAAAIAPAKLREARFSDFHAVAELKQRWGLNPDSFENWERLWRRNPALAQSNLERPIGWVLEADGAVVGYLGNVSLLYRYGDKTLTAATAHGLVVDPPYRAVGLTLVAAFFRQKSVDLFISTTAIEAVGKIALAFKSSPLPQPDYDTAFFWVLRPYGFARGLVKKLKLGPALSQIGSVLTALAVGTDKILRRRWVRKSSTGFTVREIGVDDIGNDFQDLWTAKQAEARCLLADRSPATLRWHFEIPGDRGSARVLCCYQQTELVGYTVVRIDTNQETGLRTSIIADLVAKQDDPEVVGVLWAAAYDTAKHAGSHILEVLGFPPNIRQVGLKWHPYRRKYPACPFYYKAADPVLHKALSDGTAWYASPFDGDATLIRPSYSTSASSAISKTRMQDASSPIVPNVLEQEHSEVF